MLKVTLKTITKRIKQIVITPTPKNDIKNGLVAEVLRSYGKIDIVRTNINKGQSDYEVPALGVLINGWIEDHEAEETED